MNSGRLIASSRSSNARAPTKEAVNGTSAVETTTTTAASAASRPTKSAIAMFDNDQATMPPSG